MYHSTLGLRVIKKEKRGQGARRPASAGLTEMMDSLVRSHEEKRCSILRPTQSRVSPSALQYTKIFGVCELDHMRSTVEFPDTLYSLSTCACTLYRCRENTARKTQSRSDSGLGFQVKVFKSFEVVPSSFESGTCREPNSRVQHECEMPSSESTMQCEKSYDGYTCAADNFTWKPI